MAEAIYILSAVLSAACAYLLLRRGTKARLMFWSGLSFAGLALNNGFLVADLVFMPTLDLSLLRTATALVSMLALLFGFIWESH